MFHFTPVSTSIVFLWMTWLCVAYGLFCQRAVFALYGRRHRLVRGTTPISVLRPLRGVDDELCANLESLCRQDHPCFELILCAADPDDPALPVAEEIARRYRGVNLRIVSGEWREGANPKVRLLRTMLGLARHPAILISDSNVRVAPDYLSVMAGALDEPGVGLVSNLILGEGERSLGAHLENLLLNTAIVGGIAGCAEATSHPVVMGKSMLFSRTALAQAGGFGSVADVLAEDYLLGVSVRNAGYRVRTLGHPVYTVNRSWTILRTFGRHLRWAVIRRSIAPHFFGLELLGHPELFAIATLLAASSTPGADTGVRLGALSALGLSGLATSLLLFRLCGVRRGLKLMMLWPIGVVLRFAVWSSAWFTSRVDWRGIVYRVGRGSRLTPNREALVRDRSENVRWA